MQFWNGYYGLLRQIFLVAVLQSPCHFQSLDYSVYYDIKRWILIVVELFICSYQLLGSLKGVRFMFIIRNLCGTSLSETTETDPAKPSTKNLNAACGARAGRREHRLCNVNFPLFEVMGMLVISHICSGVFYLRSLFSQGLGCTLTAKCTLMCVFPQVGISSLTCHLLFIIQAPSKVSSCKKQRSFIRELEKY